MFVYYTRSGNRNAVSMERNPNLICGLKRNMREALSDAKNASNNKDFRDLALWRASIARQEMIYHMGKN